MNNAVVIHAADNVATAVVALHPGDTAITALPDGTELQTLLQDEIPIYHKYAIAPIMIDQPVIKYGEHIGVATADIQTGQHVHIHNVQGRREDLRAKNR